MLPDKSEEMTKIGGIEQFSKTGTFHTERNLENQDFFLHSANDRYEIISLADGVSSCANGGIGAAIACNTVNELFTECGALLFGYTPKKLAHIIAAEVFRRLVCRAEEMNEPVSSFASTLCFACVEIKSGALVTFQLGDSRVYTSCGEEYRCVFGDKALPGFTVCDNAGELAEVAVLREFDTNGVLLMSDGAWRELEDKAHSDRIPACGGAYELKTFFEKTLCMDDCSFIFMDFEK